MLIEEAPFAVLIAFIALLGLYLSNIFLDFGSPQYLSRKAGHFFGGTAYLLSAFLFSSPWWPIALSGSFTALLGGARLLRPTTFRGVGGSARPHALAECWFPGAATVSLCVGWAWLDDPFLAVVPILFMAWGDCCTGIVRSRIYHREMKGNWGSMAMVSLCLVVAYLFSPYWVAAAGAVAATLAERFTLGRKWIDDNYTIIGSSLALMAVLGG